MHQLKYAGVGIKVTTIKQLGGEHGRTMEGVITNQAIHHIDLLQWFMGPVIEVFAYSRTFGDTNIEVEDSVVAIVSFKSGSVATIEATFSVRPRNLGVLCR